MTTDSPQMPPPDDELPPPVPTELPPVLAAAIGTPESAAVEPPPVLPVESSDVVEPPAEVAEGLSAAPVVLPAVTEPPIEPVVVVEPPTEIVELSTAVPAESPVVAEALIDAPAALPEHVFNERPIELAADLEADSRNQLIEPLPSPEPAIDVPEPVPSEFRRALKWAVNAVLILIIAFIILATWLPAIYTSHWFQTSPWVKTHLLQTTPVKR